MCQSPAHSILLSSSPPSSSPASSMAAELETLGHDNPSAASPTLPKKRKPNKVKRRAEKQKPPAAAAARRRKPTKRLLKLFRKRARDYNSDSADGEASGQEEEPNRKAARRHTGGLGVGDAEAGADSESESEASSAGFSDEGRGSEEEEEEEGGGHHRGVMRFNEGCRAFKIAFSKIIKKNLPDDPLGPILAGHKKLVAAKLAEEEEEEEHKVKGEAKKEKHLAAEKGHVKPAGYLDEREKLLIRVATKGVVRLFNAVSKAQNPQNDLNPSRSKDAKALAKERKQAFLSELKNSSKRAKRGQTSSNSSKHIDEDADEPGWAPLRDTYMLGSKLKDWDKMPDSAAIVEQAEAAFDNSDDE